MGTASVLPQILHLGCPSPTLLPCGGLNENGSWVWMLGPHLVGMFGRTRRCGLLGGGGSWRRMGFEIPKAKAIPS